MPTDPSSPAVRPAPRAGAPRLEGRVAVVTGAGSGIGRATAARLAAEGASVVASDRDEAAARETASVIGDRALAVQADVTDADAMARLVEQAVARFGGVDVFHNNAGMAQAAKPLADVGRAEWDALIAVNLTAFFVGAQAVAPAMRERGGGSIVVTASTSAVHPRPGLSAYAAAKSGVLGLTRALALELAADRIRVNAINPVAVKTPMLQEFRLAAEDELLDKMAATIPLGSAIDAEDVAAAVAYLASDDARFVTGIALNVDGGRDL
ncbi:SDR family oxidoreductase [Patulibacter sp. SYSU D01012]|uniref:SDR family oxidoreductase n=1 Tax=Patulibacter sp. SYSU D01012 TaxID=2817381 RepID=UPI001B30C728